MLVAAIESSIARAASCQLGNAMPYAVSLRRSSVQGEHERAVSRFGDVVHVWKQLE